MQLPDSYRVVNKESIERAKEQARRVQEASLISSAIPITDDILSLKDKLAANSSAYQRFRSDLVSFDSDPLQPLQSNDYALEEYKQQLEKQEKVMKSTDDHALAMFKKVNKQ